MRWLKSVSQVAIGAAIGVLAGGSIVWAHGGDTSLVHACVVGSQPNSPNLRIIGASETCGTGSALDWNMVGPTGPPGVQGPPGGIGAVGPQGARGPAGPPPSTPVLRDSIVRIGIPRRTIRWFSGSIGPNAGTFKSANLPCPSTYPLVLNGSYRIVFAPGVRPTSSFTIRSNTRWVSGGRQGWGVAVSRDRPSAIPWRLVVYAECAHTS
jgi:hypothetical protein